MDVSSAWHFKYFKEGVLAEKTFKQVDMHFIALSGFWGELHSRYG
jgi:hypothetical protein